MVKIVILYELFYMSLKHKKLSPFSDLRCTFNAIKDLIGEMTISDSVDT